MKKNIFVMNLLVLLFWMSVNVYVPNLPAYAQSLGANAVILGLIGGAYGIAMIIIRIPLGLMTDNTSRRRDLLLIGSVILVASCGILVFSGNTDGLVIGRLLAGASGAWWVTQNATYANYYNEANQLKAQGMLSASMNWGKLAAALVGGIMAQLIGIESVFICALAIAVICIVLTLQLKDARYEVSEKKTIASYLPVLKNADLIIFTILSIMINMMAFAAPIIFTLVAAQDLGGSSLDMGLLNASFFLAAALSSLFVGTRWYRRIGGVNAMVIAFALGSVSCFPFFYHMHLLTIYLIQIFSGISFGVTGAALGGMVNRCVLPAQRGIAIAIYNCLNAVGVLVGPILIGNIINVSGFDVSYWTLAVILAAAAVLCLVLIPKKYAKM